MTKKNLSYSEGIRNGFDYILSKHSNSLVLGQGVWSPWYVGSTMKDLEKKFGKKRILDTPVSENAVTGAAFGASLEGNKVIVVHPRMDFMMYCMDPIINQAAKWSTVFGGKSKGNLTIRGIINRGGEQGAQHSQSLHSLFVHIPGIKVVMPGTANDARDLLIASVRSNYPVLYIDDRWLYNTQQKEEKIKILDLNTIKPLKLKSGNEFTIVGCGYGTKISSDVHDYLKYEGIKSDVFDLRVLSDINYSDILKSVQKTGRLVCIDPAWPQCSLGSEVISSICEKINLQKMKSSPIKFNIKNAPAPTSSVLEKDYYFDAKDISKKLISIFYKKK